MITLPNTNLTMIESRTLELIPSKSSFHCTPYAGKKTLFPQVLGHTSQMTTGQTRSNRLRVTVSYEDTRYCNQWKICSYTFPSLLLYFNYTGLRLSMPAHCIHSLSLILLKPTPITIPLTFTSYTTLSFIISNGYECMV